jgi:hypothetical protein
MDIDEVSFDADPGRGIDEEMELMTLNFDRADMARDQLVGMISRERRTKGLR